MRRLATVLSGTSFLGAWVSTVYLLTVPVYQGIQTSSGTESGRVVSQQVTQTLLEATGPWVIGILGSVALLSGVLLLTALRTPWLQRSATWVTALLLLAFSIVTGFSVGSAFLPSAMLLLLSAVATLFIDPPPTPADVGRRGTI